jgi:excisionase family DNA binding protein
VGASTRKRENGVKTKGLLTVAEFAELTGWRTSTVRQKVWRREIEFVRMGRCIRFRPETVERLIEEGTVPPLRDENQVGAAKGAG